MKNLNLQEDCSDDEVDPDVDPPEVPDNPTVGQILHIDQDDAVRLTGSLMNDFTREIIQVNLYGTFNRFPHQDPPPNNEKLLNRYEKWQIRRKSCVSASKSCASADLHFCSFFSPIRLLQIPTTYYSFYSVRSHKTKQTAVFLHFWLNCRMYQ